MSAETTALLRRVSRRAAQDPDSVLPVLRVLAGRQPYDPVTPDPPVEAVALVLNATRVERARRDFTAHALRTGQVAEILGVGSRQAVAQRRARGGLLGEQRNGTTYYPAWQFVAGGAAPGLGRLLGMLPAGIGAAAADALMRTPHGELAGRTLADLFAAGDWDDLAGWLGDIGGWWE